MPAKIPTGSVFQKSYRDRHGVAQKTATWYLKFYTNGKPMETSSGTEDYNEALKLLREKMAAAASKSYDYSEDLDRVSVNQLLDLVVHDYRDENRQNTYDTSKRIDAHLRPFFGNKRAVDVGTKLMKEYRRLRITEAAEASVNKELAWLRRAFYLGLEHEPRARCVRSPISRSRASTMPDKA
jgi:hypothetical protein